MGTYTLSADGIERYIDAVNGSAMKMLRKTGTAWNLGTDPVYPLLWYISSGRLPTPSLRKLLSVHPDIIARILLSGGSDQEIMMKILRRLGFETEEM